MSRTAQVTEPERRLALLKAAFREVAEKGFSEVTLDDIARRAGVSKGITLYYFDSKEELFRELFGWLIDSIHARMREAVAAEDPVAKVRALVALIFPVALEEPRVLPRVRGLLRAWPRGARPSARSTSASTRAAARSTAAIVEEGMRRGVFLVRDRHEAGSTMRAMFDGLMMQWLSEKDPEASFGAYRDRCERELLHYLLARGSEEGGEPMNASKPSEDRCRNDACPRPVEAGEPYCATCGLERALFRRDARAERERIRASRGGPRAER